jgi:aminoglycoside phosphotransferase (APT) family kinase protein
MASLPGLTQRELAALCLRAFPDRPYQRIEAVQPLASRQHQMVAFRLRWSTVDGEVEEPLIVRRYVSALSWWRPDDLGKAQREAAVVRWLHEQDFPVPQVYAREFGALGDVVLFSRLPGSDWSVTGLPFPETVRPYVGEFARLLARLHGLKPPEDVLSVAPTVTLPTALTNLMALALRMDQPDLTGAIERALTHAYDVPESERVLLHGDYHFSNALLDEGRISGIVDWEYCALGDPRWDVANAYTQLVDFDAASAADAFLSIYLQESGRIFSGPPLHTVVAPLQQWTISEWVVREQAEGHSLTFALAEDLVALRDVHRRRALSALGWLD